MLLVIYEIKKPCFGCIDNHSMLNHMCRFYNSCGFYLLSDGLAMCGNWLRSYILMFELCVCLVMLLLVLKCLIVYLGIWSDLKIICI